MISQAPTLAALCMGWNMGYSPHKSSNSAIDYLGVVTLPADWLIRWPCGWDRDGSSFIVFGLCRQEGLQLFLSRLRDSRSEEGCCHTGP